MSGEVNRWSPEEAIDRRERPESTLEAEDERDQLLQPAGPAGRSRADRSCRCDTAWKASCR